MRKYPSYIFECRTSITDSMNELRRHLGEILFEFIKTWEPVINGFVVMDKVDDLEFEELHILYTYHFAS